jgi:hypothetical protein
LAVFVLLLAGVAAAGVAYVIHTEWALAPIVAAVVLLSAAVIVTKTRSRQRTELFDRYIVTLAPLLGWREITRDNVVASRWAGGWIGHPCRILIRYNPLADDQALEILDEARRQAKRRFDGSYKIHKHKDRQGLIILIRAGDINETDAEKQDARVNALVAKTFGAGTGVQTKFVNGDLREFTVKYEVSPKLASAALRHQIETRISAPLEGRWRAFWDLQHDSVKFELRPSLASLIPNPSVAPETVDPLASYDSLEVPIGIDEDGHVISWRPKRDPHGLVTGKTGKGKTVVLLGIIMYLAAHGWKVWGIDGKRIELLGLRDYPNVELIAGRIDHQARVAHEMFRMMQQRFEDYEAGRVKLEDFEPVFFVIDEYKTFRNAVTRWFRSVKPKGPGSQAPVLEEISDFVSLARKVRMHLVIGLQRPDAEFLTGDMRDNFNFRVSLGRLSPDGAKMMWDSFSTGVAIPPFAIGRGIAHNKEGQPVEIQTFWTPDPYQTDPEHPEIWVHEGDLQIVEQLRPKVTLHELKQIIDPDDWADLDDEKSTKEGPDYNDYMATRIIAASRVEAEPRRLAAGIYQAPKTDVATLERIQIESEEPEVEDDIFEGYGASTELSLDEIFDEEGHPMVDGTVVLVDADAPTWGLVFSCEEDMEDGYIAIDYRDFHTGEVGAISLPDNETLSVRLPEGR